MSGMDGAIPEDPLFDFRVERLVWFDVVAGEEPEDGVELEVVALPPGVELP